MSEQSAERRKHLPTQRRLEQLRKEGQVPTSPELRTSVAFCAGLLALIVMAGGIHNDLQTLLSIAINGSARLSGLDAELYGTLISLAGHLALIAGASVLALLLAAMIDADGIVLSANLLKNAGDRLNPLHGIRERFRLRSLVETVKTLIKGILLVLVAIFVLRYRLSDLANMPLCDFACATTASLRMLLELAVVLAALMLVFGLIDLKISRILFKHQHKMTDTQVKQEQKEDHGSDVIRRKRQELRQELRQEQEQYGPGENAPLGRQADGFGEEHTGIDRLVIRGRLGQALVTFDRRTATPPILEKLDYFAEVDPATFQESVQDLPILIDEEAFSRLDGQRRGEPIPDSSYAAVASCFKRAGLLSGR